MPAMKNVTLYNYICLIMSILYDNNATVKVL